MLATAAESTEVVHDGHTLVGDPKLHRSYLSELAADRHDGLMSRLFRKSIPRGGAVVDGGAFLGHHTLMAARQVGPRGRVMAFEPNPASYRALRGNVHRNGYEDRVIALPLGVGAWSTQVRTLSLDTSVGGRRIDVVRLAIEGGEVDAIRGMRRTLELSPGARLFVECNPAALARAGTSAETLLGELRDLGFRSQVIEEIHGELVPAGAWLDELPAHVQLMCEPASVRRRLARRVRGARREAPVVAQV